jgi:O-antigen/teichoic acid export membrane protein
MTRTARFLDGLANGYLHLVATALIGLWLTPFLLRHLGGDTYGLWLVGTQIVAYLLLMDLGVVALLPRETAYVTGRTGRSDAPELQNLVEKAFTLAVVQTPFVIAASAAALYWFPSGWAPLRAPLVAVLGLFALTFPLRVFQAVLTGLQDLGFVARVQLAAWAIGTIVNIGLVLAGFTLSALAAGWCATQLLIVFACAHRLRQKFPGLLPRRLHFGAASSLREYVVRSAWISVSQVSQVLLNGTDVMVVAALLGPGAVVPFACTGKLVSVLANQPQAILQSAAPALSELRTAGDRQRLFVVSAALAQATLAVSGLVACVVLAVNAGFVSWWVGPEQYAGLPLTLLILGGMMVRHYNTTNVYALFCFGHERRLALTGLADGVATLVLTVVLIELFGLAGAPLGAIAGVLLVGGPLNLAALARETGVERGRLLGALGPWFWRFTAIMAVAGAAGTAVQPSTFAGISLMAVAAGLVYAVAVVPPLLQSPAGVYLRPVLARLRRAVSLGASDDRGDRLTATQ